MSLHRYTAIRNIAVPVDTTGREVIALAERLAQQCDATLHLFSAKNYSMWATSLGGEYVFAPIGPTDQLASDEVMRRTEEVQSRAREIDAPTEVTVVAGETESSLHEFIDREAIDLVVTATRGIGFWTRLLHTSLAGNLSRAASVPVLIAPPDVDLGPVTEHGILRVVIATNGRTIADLGGLLAASLSRPGAAVSFVYVADAGLPGELGSDDERRRELESIIDEVSPTGCTTTAVIEHGDVAETVVRYAAEHRADLLVVGARRHSDPGDRLLGTTADRVLGSAPCCVLAIPEAVLEDERQWRDRERVIDETIDESFPASDPPSYTPT